MTTELTYPHPIGDPDDRGEPIRPVVTIAEKHLYIGPGTTERATVTVRNVSGIIETFDFTVLGPSAPWVSVQPPYLSLFPGDEDSASITLRTPLSPAVVAGDYVLGIRAQSQVDPACFAADEVIVSVEPFYRFETELSRSTFQVRTKANAQVRLANKGNSTMTYSVSAVDPESYVRIVIKDALVTLAPGESVWLPITLKVAPRIFGTVNDTLPVIATIVPLRNEDAGIPIVDPEPESQVINLLHRPIIRLRLGIFGKLVLLIGILALIAAFILSRVLDATPPPVTGAPPSPTDFAAKLNSDNQPVLTWQPSPGATGYSIYAIGDAGNPVPAPTPTVVIEAPTPSASAVAFTGGSLQVTLALAPLPRTSTGPTAAPSPSATQNLALEEALPSPVCIGCTEIGTVDGGTTRYVVEQVNAGKACYRIAASVGTIKSLYSPPTCVTVLTADEAAAAKAEASASASPGSGDAAGGAGGAGGAGASAAPAGPPPPCEPVLTEARVVSPTALAILWQPATEPPKGWTAPEPSASPSPATRGGDSAASKGADDAAASKVCDPAAKITGWSIQRKIFTGWSDVTPEPKPNDTAIEVADLEAGTRYCFRMASKSATGDSRYTKKFCATTPEAASPSASPNASTTPPASTTQPVQDAPA